MTRYAWIAMNLALLVLIGCDRTRPADVSEILPAPDHTPIQPKSQLGLNVQVSGAGPIKFRWNATRGEISDPTGPAILYTAPDSAGPATVTVEVTGKGWSTFKTRDFTVAAATPPSPAPASAGGVTLAAPQDGEQVPCQVFASGAYPPDLTEKIWPVVLVGGRYHPQDEGGRAPRMSNGKWRGTVRFGVCDQPDRDRGIQFTLMVVTANEQANQAFESYVRNAAPGFAGMDQLPEGAESKVEIGVVRK